MHNIDTRKESHAITKALRSLLDKATAAGCEHPVLFFEAESAAVFVMDHDHPGDRRSDIATASERQEAVVLRCDIHEPFDTGAW